MLRPAYSLINSEFNEFLFAPLCDEANGMTLSVFSALTRLGLDPWEQAASLRELPRAVAHQMLTSMIARSLAGRSQASEARIIAARVIALLPTAKPENGALGVTSLQSWKRVRTAVFLLAALLLAVVLLFGPTLKERLSSTTDAAPAATIGALPPAVR